MKAKHEKIVEHHLAAKEFKRRFPEIWDSFSNQQKKHIVYAMNGWRALEQLEPEGEVRVLLIHFLDSIRDYEHESHNLLGHDERESSEFVDIYLKDNFTPPPQQPNEGKIREMLKDFDVCKFAQNPKHDFQSPYDATDELIEAIKELLNR